MGDEKIQGGEGPMYDSIQDVSGSKTYGSDAEPMDPAQAGAASGSTGDVTEGMPEGPDPRFPPASPDEVHEAATRAEAAFGSAADQGPAAPKSDENA
ncbi:MAG: hypothetical protein M3198_00655 [Actinomycetota bacterium]|nr:hypothetical protein [Actinomycetota bacterium]